MQSLAVQLYIALYFTPETLHGDNDVMRTVAGRLFRGNWVLPWAPGQLVDVSLHWQPYRYWHSRVQNLSAVLFLKLLKPS